MKVHTYEKAFLSVGGIFLVVCLGALFYASEALHKKLPGDVNRIDPLQVYSTPPFDKPGVRQTGPNAYDVVVIGQMWSFTPNAITIPVGADITFIATSTDVIHGLYIAGTRVNLMLVPGQVAKNTYRFEKAGEHLLICHEYCGLAHHNMFGKVTVK